MNNELIKLDKVSRTFTKGNTIVEALTDISCEIKVKDRIAIVGPSGSGKSTLLNILGCIDKPTSGNITWLGFDSAKPLRPSQISYVFQMQSLIPSLSIEENVMLPLLLMGKHSEEARIFAHESLKTLELSDLSSKLPEELSGGQVQRVAVARMLCVRPKLILADEPTGQLDHPTANKLMNEVLTAIKDLDTAIVIATHDLSVAERMDKRWVMDYGKLVTL